MLAEAAQRWVALGPCLRLSWAVHQPALSGSCLAVLYAPPGKGAYAPGAGGAALPHCAGLPPWQLGLDRQRKDILRFFM